MLAAQQIAFPIVSPIVPLPVLDTTVSRVEISPGVSALPPAFSVRFGNETETNVIARDFQMTQTQWNEWAEEADDAAYILACAAAVLGFTVPA